MPVANKAKRLVFSSGVLTLLLFEACGGGSNIGTSSGNGGEGGVPATVADTVPVDVGPTGVTVDATTNQIYVVNFPGYCGAAPFGGVTQIDGSNDANTGEAFSISQFEGTGTTFTVTNVPVAVAADSATGMAYIFLFGLNCSCCPAASGHSHVVSFDLASTAASSLSIGGAATPGSPYIQHNAIAVNSVTGKAYLANNLTTSILVTSPPGVDVNSQTDFIYVANAGNAQAGDRGNITVIDGAKQTTTTLTDSEVMSPVAVSVNSNTNKIYVANSGSNNVTVIDGAHD